MKKDLNLISFSLPFLLSYFLQTFYGLADLYIIGLFEDTASTTAVAVSSQIMHMVTVIIVGLAMGSTVMLGQYKGANDNEKMKKTIANTIGVFAVLSLIITILMLITIDGIIEIMSVPDMAVSETKNYLFVSFIGIIFITAYNIISCIYRGLGDSKTPMYFVIIACIFNVGLDFIFIGVFSLKSMGAALGSLLAQTVAVITAIIYLRIRKNIQTGSLSFKEFKPDFDIIKKIFSIGAPVSIQDACIQISFIVITVFANRRGLNDAAAVGIVEKIIGVLFLIPSTMLSSVSALCAISIGAGKKDEAKRLLKEAIVIATAIGLVFAISMQFAGAEVVGLFSNDSEVISLGESYLRPYVFDCVFAGIHFCFSGYFCACNKSGISFFHNIVSIITLRIPIAYLASVYTLGTLFYMGLGAPAGSVLSVIICLIFYRRLEGTKI